MKVWPQIAVLLHLVSSGVVEPRIRQASSNINTETIVPAKVPTIIRRRKSNVELIHIPSTGGSENGDNDHGGSRLGIMTTLKDHPQQLNLEALNNAARNNQLNFMVQFPKLDLQTKNRHEQPSLVERLNQRNKKFAVEELAQPEAILRAMSLSVSSYGIFSRDVSMSMDFPKTRSNSDFDLALREERNFFLRSGSLSMLVDLPEDREIVLFQMSGMSMSLGTEVRSTRAGPKWRIQSRESILNQYQMIDMSMPSEPTPPSPETLPPGSTSPPATMPSIMTTIPTTILPGQPTMAPGSSIPTLVSESSSSLSPSAEAEPPSMPDRTLSPTEASSNEFPSGLRSSVRYSGMVGSVIVLLCTIMSVIW
ncbi:hypothetical protein IV203_034613 [Nitzschia inconspicua]|uniref:Uncharacterized protein n=1 Tax=Nitzschia inconspicua TaxID=303405 RepID=A0A9K3PTS9_9STRA|nr:hypothetical protein IV203_002673 [Nitzschia inconspicua]KAG7359515.1 hypothetical protein IV203_034613 [Nitzschia inconspicua]